MSERFEADQWVTVAVLGRAWGRRGELTASSLTSGPERFEGVKEVFLFGPGAPGADAPVALESVWEHRGGLVFKFQGFDTISDAERLAGAEVRIPAVERAPLAEGEYYQSDLIGCDVIERSTGERLGRIADWMDSGAAPLLDVRDGAKPLLIPFARSICTEIDVPGRKVLVDLPEGLKDL